ncbi:MAG: hypothetical protein KDC12_14930 [Flavobacteriales bacterium]|nr:hypothetical protein [Flavobacteriales bacterium]
MNKLFILIILLAGMASTAQQSFNPSITPTGNETESSSVSGTLTLRSRLFGMDYYIGNEEVSKRAFEDQLKLSPTAYNKYKSGMNTEYTGIVIGWVGAFIGGLGLSDWMLGADPNWLVIGGGSTLALVGSFMESAGIDKRISAVENYNQYSLSMRFSKYGVGLAFQF